MRYVPPLLLLLLAATGAYAQTPQIDRIDVVEYGIYTNTIENKQANQNSPTGQINEYANIRLAATTHTIPAQLGVTFGEGFTVIGTPNGARVPLHVVVIFPPSGLRNPAMQQPSAHDEWDQNASIGERSHDFYTFENGWEVVPGVWTMQIWYQGRKLAEQSFTVVRQ